MGTEKKEEQALSTSPINGATNGSPSTHPPALHVVEAEERHSTIPAPPPKKKPRSDAGKPRPKPTWDVYSKLGWVWRVEARTEEEAMDMAMTTLPENERTGVWVQRRKAK